MPLLGRHKSLPGLAGANQSAAGGSKQPTPPLVCESPLFGVRRQLPVAGSLQAAAAEAADGCQQAGAEPAGLSTSASLTANLSGRLMGRAGREARAEAAAALERVQQLEQTLGSIPAQITRQQLHYAFSFMDSNADGLIDQRDLSQMLANLGVPIDEAILSHVLAPVARRRGDQLISESEFLDWLASFMQVSEQEESSAQGPARRPAAGATKSARRAAGAQGARAHVARSASASAGSAPQQVASSLATQSPEAQHAIGQQLRQRRGSGSGLALTRSLSSAPATGSPDVDDQRQAHSPGHLEPNSSSRRERLLLEQQEARRDLKAAFCVFDLDGDGFITLDEVQQGLKLLGESWTPAELDQLFSKCASQTHTSGASKSAASKRPDLSQRRRISIDDFVQLLL